MKVENLELAIAKLKSIPYSKFNMRLWRHSNQVSIECKSVGCVIGHCVELDPNPEEIPRKGSTGAIDFMVWSFIFFDVSYSEWYWCFGEDWADVDNTANGAAKRIKFLITKGLPQNWDEQLKGKDKLTYKYIKI